MKQKIVGIFVCMLMIATVVLPAAGTMNKMENLRTILLYDNTSLTFTPGEIIVKLKKDTTFSQASLTALNTKYQVYDFEKVFPDSEGTILDNIYLLHIHIGSDILSIVKEYTSCPDVMYAEPNYKGKLPLVPNDEYFFLQWNLNNSGQFGGTPDADIDATDAWNITTGNTSIIIASVDSGVDYTHPDLSDRIWVNPGEDFNGNGVVDPFDINGIDDDGNGFIDDFHGWDFSDNDNTPLDRVGHGTWCAGMHGAVTNNLIGIAGVDWNCKTMVLRCYNVTSGQQSWFAQGIVYAADNGADIINVEWYQYSIPLLIKDAVDYAYEKGCFLIAAAGNDNLSTPAYPAAFENVTAVGATNQFDERCDEDDWGPGAGSNWGSWLDIAAPGQWIGSTSPTYADFLYHTEYGWPLNYVQPSACGTSSAAPHVAGVAALLLSLDPSLNQEELKSFICDNVDPYNSTVYIGTGRINAYKALAALINQPPIADFSWTPPNPVTNQQITFNASSSADPDGTITLYEWDWDNDGVYDVTQSSPTTGHAWAALGHYPVTVRVTDEYNAFDIQTKTVFINDTLTFNIDITGGFGVTAVITNNGTVNATNMQWAFTLTGGLILLGKKKNGTITALTPGTSTTVSDKLILGFGKTTITLEVSCAEEQSCVQTKEGFQLFVFTLVTKNNRPSFFPFRFFHVVSMRL